jgi:hypothetical protein
MRNVFIVVLGLFLLLPAGVAAQGDDLEQRFANEEFSFDYPMGWTALPRPTGSVLVNLNTEPETETPEVLILTFVTPTASEENRKSWPVDADLTFLLGYVTCEVVTGITEEDEYVDYEPLETIEVGEMVVMSITFEGQDLSGNVAAIEDGEHRLIAITFGSKKTFREQEDVLKSIILSVEFSE